MIKITAAFEKKLAALRQKTLRQRIQYAFDTVWYNSGIPDYGTPALRQACDLMAPKNEDDDMTLQAKGFLIHGLSRNILDDDTEAGDASILEIEACVVPEINRRGIKELSAQQQTENAAC